MCEVFFNLSAKDQRRTLKLDNITIKGLKEGPQRFFYAQDFDVPDGTLVEEMNINKYGGWEPYAEGKDSITKIMLHGLSDKGPQYLAQVARSWVNPPKLEIIGEGYEFIEYDPTQMAYIIKQNQNQNQSLCYNIWANKESPLVNPAFVLKSWETQEVDLKINGKSLVKGKDFRTGHVETLSDSNLIIWIKTMTDEKTSFSIIPLEK
jgi:hypothetical protein